MNATTRWPWLRSDRAVAFLLVAAVVLVYGNSLAAPFQFDDWWLIVGNPNVDGLAGWWRGMPGIRPLLKLSYAINATLSHEPAGYRAFDIAVHAGNAVLVWLLARRWLAALAPDLQLPRRAALAVALLFALHPAATEAVTYLSGRSMSLMALCVLASLWLHEDGAPTWRRALSRLMFALALAVRETAAVLPLVLFWFALCSGMSWRLALKSASGHFAVLAAAIVAAAMIPGYRSFFGWSLGTRGIFEQWLGQMQAHAYLVAHPLLGIDSNIDPQITVPIGIDATTILVSLALAGTVVLALMSRRRWPWLAFGLGWYLLQLLPSNSFLPRFDLANDRHLYLAMIGPALILGVGLSRLRPPLLFELTLLGLTLTLALATVRRNHDYRSELALWDATVRSSPGKARPWANLGYARQLAGDPAGAAAAYRCSLRLDPHQQKAAINLMLLSTPWRDAPERPDDCRRPTGDG